MTDARNLDSRYLDWLYSQIGPVRHTKNPSRTFFLLAEQLFKKPFTWYVPNDDNRAEDGKDLRQAFLSETGAEGNREWMEFECSMLELMIALSRRAEFESAHNAHYWFWKIAENMGLRVFTDEVYDEEAHMLIDTILDTVIDRQYQANGEGGMFPLDEYDRDQREVELWYQMSSYLLENGYE